MIMQCNSFLHNKPNSALLVSSKEVFEKRKTDLDNAYQMAKTLPLNDKWNIRALAWCLVDLIKREGKKENNQTRVNQFINELNSLNIPEDDDLLLNQIEWVINPDIQDITQAKELSKEHKYGEAANILVKIARRQPKNKKVHESLAWNLYYLSKDKIETNPINLNYINRYFHEYFLLNLEKPSILHTNMLRLALKLFNSDSPIIGNQSFNFIDFFEKWKPEFFTHEDYKEQSFEGKKIQPFALNIWLAACKSSLKNNNLMEMNWALDKISQILEESNHSSCSLTNQHRFGNIDLTWLKWQQIKLFLALNQNDKAINSLILFAKQKNNEFWVWEKLGDAHQHDDALKIACYCKALLCKHDINFVSKVKLKLASFFLENGDFMRAGIEIQEILDYKNQNNQEIKDDLLNYSQQSWFQEYQNSNHQNLKNNTDFYQQWANQAEELLYYNLPWQRAVLGKTFQTDINKIKRIIYLENMDNQAFKGIPHEINISEKRLPESLKKAKENTSIRLKGEWQATKKFQVYCLEKDNQLEDWSIFTPYLGVLDHLNHEKKIAHFILDKNLDIVIKMEDLPKLSNKKSWQVLDVAEIRLYEYTNSKGEKNHKAISIQKSEQAAPKHLLMIFSHEIVSKHNNLGFTENGIFIDKNLINQHNINDDATISGIALLNFNQKKRTWGWKATKITQVFNIDDLNYD